MHVNLNDPIGPFTVRDAREALKNLSNRWTFRDMQRQLGGTSQATRTFLDALVSLGYIERNQQEYEKTPLGKTFMLAPARTILRSTADQLVCIIPTRAPSVNSQPFAYTVTRIEVFGSYLSDAPRLGDVDIFVTLQPRFTDTEQQEKRIEERKKQCPSSDFLRRMFWAEEEVLRAIRGGNNAISLLLPDHAPFYDSVARKTIFEKDSA